MHCMIETNNKIKFRKNLHSQKKKLSFFVHRVHLHLTFSTVLTKLVCTSFLKTK